MLGTSVLLMLLVSGFEDVNHHLIHSLGGTACHETGLSVGENVQISGSSSIEVCSHRGLFNPLTFFLLDSAPQVGNHDFDPSLDIVFNQSRRPSRQRVGSISARGPPAPTQAGHLVG